MEFKCLFHVARWLLMLNVIEELQHGSVSTCNFCPMKSQFKIWLFNLIQQQ
jgi:hypothetical protein